MTGNVTLLGSGELMAAMSKVHRAALAAVPAQPRPVFIEATAGFETNVDAIVEKAVEYYRHHLQLDLRLARYRHRDAPGADVARAVAEIKAANFIFAGPGSPTYTVRHLRGTPIWEALVDRFEDGAHLLFASAASIAIGRYALPVYELFKAGEDPFWADGLDLFGRIGLNLAVVPHFDDASGGDNYDTRFCYVGARRFDVLQELLPADVTILGIDGYTAVTFDVIAREVRVSGQGALTTIGEGELRRWPSGSVVRFEELQTTSRTRVTTHRDGETPVRGYEFADGPGGEAGAFGALVAYIERLDELSPARKGELLALLRAAREEAAKEADSDSALVDLVLDLRQRLREDRRFDIADQTRDRLTDLGYEVQDAPGGSTWHRRR